MKQQQLQVRTRSSTRFGKTTKVGLIIIDDDDDDNNTFIIKDEVEPETICSSPVTEQETPKGIKRGRSGSDATARSGTRSASSSRASSPRPKVYFCDFPDCGKAYSRPSLLEQHIRVHYDFRPFKCDVEDCSEAFLRKDHLSRHMLKHMDEKDKPFHCSFCGKGVNTSQHLRRHEKIHLKSFKCTHPGCDECFYKHQTMKAHLRNVHEDQPKQHICGVCGKEFNRPGRLADHMEKHHSDTSKMICDFPGCYKTFRVWSALHLHSKTDHPRLECEVCGKKCVGQSGLANHMLIHNEDTVVKLWKCLECDDKYHKKEDVVKHYAETHPEIELPDELKYETNESDKPKEKKKQSEEVIQYYMAKKEEEKRVKRMKAQVHNANISSMSPLAKEVSLDDVNLKISNTIKKPANDDSGSKVSNNTNTALNDDLLDSDTSVVSDYGFYVSKPTLKKFKMREAHRIPSSPDILDLIIDNVDTRLTCPYVHCKRLFRKNYDLERHVTWHERRDRMLREGLKVDDLEDDDDDEDEIDIDNKIQSDNEFDEVA